MSSYADAEHKTSGNLLILIRPSERTDDTLPSRSYQNNYIFSAKSSNFPTGEKCVSIVKQLLH